LKKILLTGSKILNSFEYYNMENYCFSIFMYMHKLFLPFFIALMFNACNQAEVKIASSEEHEEDTAKQQNNAENIKVIHVFVALCDNKYQGIVPVPAKIGNGQDAANNLYWGCGYGVKTFFSAQKNWQLISGKKFDAGSLILERLVFKYRTKEVYLVADAYDGKEIKICTVNFLKSCSGNFNDSVVVNDKTIYCGGASQILSYIGHDGLMDFTLTETYKAADNVKREAMIYACISRTYFWKHIKSTGAIPAVWTSGLCSPEAYSLGAALESRINNEAIENAAVHSAEAYSKYQKCSIRAAKKLMVYN
jgi:hypothetical protein